mmetsp:Transcript_1126/g.2832  ORF Transcript_1126/g.2832 Transcript_1126/m.2832 type:complete len:126 (-) Transcript_1126:36-413(-)
MTKTTAKSSKSPKKAVSKHQSKRSKKRVETYATYIYKVLKQIHPNIGISQKSMSTMNSFVSDMFEKIASEAGRLGDKSNKTTMMAKEVQSAVKLVLPGELANHAVSEGVKATTKFCGGLSKELQK